MSECNPNQEKKEMTPVITSPCLDLKENFLLILGELIGLWDAYLLCAGKEGYSSELELKVENGQRLEQMIDSSCNLWDISSSKEQALILHTQCCCSSVFVHIIRGLLTLAPYGGQIGFNDVKENDNDEGNTTEKRAQDDQMERLNRLTEVLMGTLANLAGTSEEIASQYARSGSDCDMSQCLFAHFVCCLDRGENSHDDSDDQLYERYSNGSVEVLCEIVRFLSAVTSYSSRDNKQKKNEWISRMSQAQLSESVSFYSALMFTMDNTLNERLLFNCCLLILNIFYFDYDSMTNILKEESGIHVMVRCLVQSIENSDENVMDCILRSFECIVSMYSEKDDFEMLRVWFTEPVEIECEGEEENRTISLLGACSMIVSQSLNGEVSEDVVDSVLILLQAILQESDSSETMKTLFENTIRGYMQNSPALVQYIMRRILSESGTNESDTIQSTLITLFHAVLDLTLSSPKEHMQSSRANIIAKISQLKRALSQCTVEQSKSILNKLDCLG